MRASLVLCLAVALPACAADTGSNTESLTARESSHHQMVMSSTDIAAMHDETASYVHDMHGMMDGAMSHCAAMMTQMETAVDDHGARMQNMTDVGAMRAECDDHHRMMMSMFDQMQHMMSCGMM